MQRLEKSESESSSAAVAGVLISFLVLLRLSFDMVAGYKAMSEIMKI